MPTSRSQDLSNQCSKFPAAALPALLGARSLEEIQLDLQQCTDCTMGALEAALAVLCATAPELKRVSCKCCPPDNGVEVAVLAALRSAGKGSVALETS